MKNAAEDAERKHAMLIMNTFQCTRPESAFVLGVNKQSDHAAAAASKREEGPFTKGFIKLV